MKAPYTMFGKTLMVKVRVYGDDGYEIPGATEWDKELWVERGEDMYALMSPQHRGKRTRVVYREDWLAAEGQDEGEGGGA